MGDKTLIFRRIGGKIRPIYASAVRAAKSSSGRKVYDVAAAASALSLAAGKSPKTSPFREIVRISGAGAVVGATAGIFSHSIGGPAKHILKGGRKGFLFGAALGAGFGGYRVAKKVYDGK